VVPFIFGAILLRVRGKLTVSVLGIVNLEDGDSRLLPNVCQLAPNYTGIKLKKVEVFVSCLIFFKLKVIKNLNRGYVSVSLGALEKLLQAIISFVMSVRLSVRPSAWNNLVPT
jgi:hypothetical protein